MAKKQDVTGMNDGALIARVAEMREELRQVRFATSGSKARDVKKLRENKKEIARTLTELSKRAARA